MPSIRILPPAMGVVLALVHALGCSGPAEPAVPDGSAPPIDSGVVTGDGGLDAGRRDGSTPPDAGRPPAAGTIDLVVVADRGAASDAVVSLGVPFPPGAIDELARVRVVETGGAERPIHVAELARWPSDGSLRSVFVAFRSTLASGAEERLTLEYGAPRTSDAPSMQANPDGPAVAMLDAEWYAQSRVSGMQVARAANARFAAYDTELDDNLGSMSPAYESYGVSCGSTSSHRTYYDGPHGLWQRYLRSAEASRYRRAREESLYYRANELEWYESRALAVQVCQADGWTPAEKINWSVIRRMTSQGMLDDYLLSGDPDAREAVAAMGEAFVRSLPAQRGGSENSLLVTERNLAWTIMGVAAYYAIESTPEVRGALDSLIDEAVAWQAAGTSGAFEHDIVRPDPSECSDGPAGGSPFMTALLIDALMDAYALTQDARIAEVVRRSAEWLRDRAATSDGRAFRYLWNCRSDPYDSSGTADLNLLIVPVFGAAYALTGDDAWLEAGDHFADVGLAEMYVGRPKQWNQAARAFTRYMGYRAVGRTP